MAQNSNLALPWYYRFAAVWGAHEGSMLLWMLILNVWTVAVAAVQHAPARSLRARACSACSACSASASCCSSCSPPNPFSRLLPPPADGADLNPVLQDPGMTFHPPVLYMGYVGFSVAFAFSIAALLGGELDKQWVRWARPWTNIAWGFLTLGIVAGSWWAYAELGWGGWWFWDPVENASFMPWLVGTALIHSQAITEKRGSLPAWTVLLSIFAFSLSLLGTFLVRSGVLTSVHAFASDPRRGVFILIYLGIVIGGSLLLYALRAPKVAGGKPFAPLSRETLLLIINLLLTTCRGHGAAGHAVPADRRCLRLGPHLGRPALLRLAVHPADGARSIMLMPLGPFARWGRADGRLLMRIVMQAVIAALVVGGVLLVVTFTEGVPPWRADARRAGLGLRGLPACSPMPCKRWREAPRGRRYPAEMLGMLIAHFGVGIFVAGVLLTTRAERRARRAPGAGPDRDHRRLRLPLQGHRARRPAPTGRADQGTVQVLEDGKPLTVLHPQKRTYDGGQMQTESVDRCRRSCAICTSPWASRWTTAHWARAHLRQAVRALDVGRRRADDARRLRRRRRPPLPPAPERRPPTRRHDARAHAIRRRARA